MKAYKFMIAATCLTVLPAVALAQGTFRGAEEGAAAGGAAAGPVGAIVGGTVGAAAGTAGAILGVDERPRFRDYVVEEHVPSYTYRESIRVGTVLPERGVVYREVPERFHVAKRYRYTVINERPVIVDPGTRRVVEVID